MAKINITVDIDWLDDVNFDDMLKDEILYGIRNYLKDKAVAEVQKKVDKEITKVISDATGVERFMNKYGCSITNRKEDFQWLG